MSEHATNRQISFLIFFSIIGYSIVELPKIAAEAGKTGAWVIILLTGVICLLPTLIVTYVNHTHYGKTWFEYSNVLIGKFLSYVLLIIFFLYTLGVFALICRTASEVVKIDFLRQVPVWQILLLMIFVICYSLSKGLTNLLRLFEFYGIVVAFIIISIHALMCTQGHIVNMRPLFQKSQIGDYLRGIKDLIMPYLGFELLMVIPFTKNNSKKIYLYTLVPIVLVGVTYIFIIQSVFALMGIDEVFNYTDVLIVAIRRLDVRSLQFLQRLDSLFVVAWFMSSFCTSSIYGYGTLYCLEKFFPKTRKHLLLIILGIITFIIAIIPGSHKEASDALLKVDLFLGLFVAILMPLIFFIMVKVKKKCIKK